MCQKTCHDLNRGTIIDTVTFGATSVTQSWSRIPDGGAWQLVNTITRNATNGTGTAVDDQSLQAVEFRLAQNYPNPFNPTTVIGYQLATASHVKIVVYDMLGREVATLVNENRSAGSHVVRFDAAGISTGGYLYRLTAGQYIESWKMVLVH